MRSVCRGGSPCQPVNTRHVTCRGTVHCAWTSRVICNVEAHCNAPLGIGYKEIIVTFIELVIYKMYDLKKDYF